MLAARRNLLNIINVKPHAYKSTAHHTLSMKNAQYKKKQKTEMSEICYYILRT